MLFFKGSIEFRLRREAVYEEIGDINISSIQLYGIYTLNLNVFYVFYF